jgi:ribosome-associated protein
MGSIVVSRTLSIDEGDLNETFVRASGPGGQHVNKVSTAVQLSFDTTSERSLTPAVRARLREVAGALISQDGVLTITAQKHRSQNRNRQEAMQRLQALILKAAQPPRKRRRTRRTQASIERRLESKKRRSRTKHMRRKVAPDT